jgi:hypothetical protein
MRRITDTAVLKRLKAQLTFDKVPPVFFEGVPYAWNGRFFEVVKNWRADLVEAEVPAQVLDAVVKLVNHASRPGALRADAIAFTNHTLLLQQEGTDFRSALSGTPWRPTPPAASPSAPGPTRSRRWCNPMPRARCRCNCAMHRPV